jgi:hypothetical protein
VNEIDWLGESLRVGEIRPEHDPVGSQNVDEAGNVLLVERIDPHVLAENVGRVFVEALRLLPVHPVERVDEPGGPGTAVLDYTDAQPRKPFEDTVCG